MIGRIKLGYAKDSRFLTPFGRDSADPAFSLRFLKCTSRDPRQLLKRVLSPYWSAMRGSGQRQTPLNQLLLSFFQNTQLACLCSVQKTILIRLAAVLPHSACQPCDVTVTVFDYSFLYSKFDHHDIVFEAL